MIQRNVAAAHPIPKVDAVRRFFPLLFGYFVATAIGAVWRDFELPLRIPVALGLFGLVSSYTTAMLDGRAMNYPLRAVLFSIGIGLAMFLAMVAGT